MSLCLSRVLLQSRLQEAVVLAAVYFVLLAELLFQLENASAFLFKLLSQTVYFLLVKSKWRLTPLNPAIPHRFRKFLKCFLSC